MRHFFNLIVLMISLILSNHANINHHLKSLLHRTTDPEYGGSFLDIDEMMQSLNISRLTAHEIQNHYRDQYSAVAHSSAQTLALELSIACLENSIDSVTERYEEEFHFRPLELRNNDFILVMDLDGTLLGQWYKLSSLIGQRRRGSFTVSVPDQRYGLSARRDSSEWVQKFSGTAVQLRPGILEFVEILEKIPEFQGIVLYSDIEDAAMVSMLNSWRKVQPAFFKVILGIFTRNHLRFDVSSGKALKDLRLFNSDLRNIFSVDDIESGVLQSHLNYKIPAFNAQSYLEESRGKKGRATRNLNHELLPYLAERISICADKTRDGGYGGILSYCFQAELGTLSKQPMGEIQAYYRTRQSRFPMDGLRLLEIFENRLTPSMELPAPKPIEN